MTAKGGLPRAPAGLGRSGKSLWRDVVGSYVLRPDELRLLAEAAATADTLAVLRASLDGRELVDAGSRGQRRVDPVLVEVRQQQVVLAALLRQLGLPENDDGAVRPATAAKARRVEGASGGAGSVVELMARIRKRATADRAELLWRAAHCRQTQSMMVRLEADERRRERAALGVAAPRHPFAETDGQRRERLDAANASAVAALAPLTDTERALVERATDGGFSGSWGEFCERSFGPEPYDGRLGWWVFPANEIESRGAQRVNVRVSDVPARPSGRRGEGSEASSPPASDLPPRPPHEQPSSRRSPPQ